MIAKKGSQKWLLIAVNERSDLLNTVIRSSAGLAPSVTIDWLSPLASENYVEYRDGAFIERLDVALPNRALFDFWPSGGPVWDGLAKTSDKEVLLLEAKAHIAEMVSPPTKASPKSREKIERALAEARKVLASRSTISWSDTFYQYTNRLAHLYLLRSLNGVKARVVFLYFTGDTEMDGPTTREEWEGAIKVTEVYLGLGRSKLRQYVHHVFIDVRDL